MKKATKSTRTFMWYFGLILALSVVPLVFLFFDGRLWHTHDGLVHVPRLGAFYTALSEGHIPPRFAGHINFGYGVPLFVFIYHIPYYIGSLFVLLGFSLMHSFMLSLAASYVLSGIFIFLFGKAFFKDKYKALWMTVFYQFAPFRFVELHMRGSYGGVYTYAFLPLTLWSLVRLFQKRTYARFVLAAVSASLLIMTHNSMSLAFYAVVALFVLFFARTKKNILVGFGSLGVGLLLSAWYFLPALLEHKYTYGNLLMKDVFYDHFVPWWHYLVPNLYNAERLRFEGITAQFGMMHVVGIVLAAFVFSAKKIKSLEKKIYVYGFLLLTGSIFLMQPVSMIVWEEVPFLTQFQFPWRLIGIVVVATSFLSLSYLRISLLSSRRIRVLILALTIGGTVYYWFPLYGYDDVDEQFFWYFPYNTTYYGETDVIWSAGPAENYPPAPVQIAEGSAVIEQYSKKSHIHTYTVVATESAWIVDNTQYFPGWRVYVNGEQVPIQFQDQNWRGTITFPVPAGTSDVRVVFGRSKVRAGAEIISLAAAAGIAGGFIVKRYRKKNTKEKKTSV